MFTKTILIHPEELDLKWIKIAKQNNIDRISIHPKGGSKAYDSVVYLMKKLLDPSFLKLIDQVYEEGMSIEYEMHIVRYLLPTSEYQNHREWFRQNANGERVADNNFCASNNEALDYISNQCEKVARKLYRNSHRYFFWLDDVKENGGCCCDKCKKYSISEQQLIINKAMLKGIRRYDPKASLAYLAYNETAYDPPVKIKPEEGIFLEYAPMDRDYHIPINDCSSIKNQKNIEALPKLIECFGIENAKILEYWLDNSLFSNWQKPPKEFIGDKKTIQKDIEYYTSLGFSDLSTFACFLGEDYRKLYGDADISSFK